MAVLVIDVGSSSVRALLFDAQSRLIEGAIATQAHQLDPVTAESDPHHLQRIVEACIDSILSHPALMRGEKIEAMALATFVGNLMGMDADNVPLTPLYTYADTRNHADVAALRDQIDVAAVHQRTGCVHHSAYHPARLHWLRRTQPAVFDRVACWLDFGTYLYRQWFDAPVACSTSVAAWSGLLAHETLSWDAEWLRVLGLSVAVLPPLADFSAACVGLSASYAARWQALRDVPFMLAVGDGAAANIGMGADDARALAVTVGTTAAIRQVTTTAPDVPFGLWRYRVDATRQLIGGATTEGGNIFQWMRRTFALTGTAAQIEAALAQRPADAHGLTFLPLLAGERSPGWQPHATGTLHGLTLATTPLDALQAALEGIATRLAMIADQLPLQPEVRVMAGGGALEASPVWAQMICDALARPVMLLAEPETTARGAAVLALGVLGKDAPPPRLLRELLPQSDAVARLQAARARQAALYRRLYDDA